MLHIILFAGSITVIFYALVQGRVFIQPEDDFQYPTSAKVPTAYPPTVATTVAEAEGDGEDF